MPGSCIVQLGRTSGPASQNGSILVGTPAPKRIVKGRAMLIKKPDGIRSSEITPEEQFVNRRKFLAAAGIATAGLMGSVRLVNAIAPAARQDDKPNTFDE